MAPPPFEGQIPYVVPGAGKPCKTYYKVFGDPATHAGPTLVVIHGGPGATHQYLLPLVDVFELYSVPVVFYDQLGCGRSTHLRERMGDASFWTFDLFIRELDNLVDHLGLRTKGFHILGQSWGGMLGGAYAALRPAGLQKVILSSAPASGPLLAKCAQQLLDDFTEPTRTTLLDCERRRDYESDDYFSATRAFHAHHICRIDPYPDGLMTAFECMRDDPSVYLALNGPSEFFLTGSYKDWEGWKDAHKIQAETLILNGRYDEVTDESVRPWFKHISKVKWVTLENSSHMSHYEDRDRFVQVVGEFLSDPDNENAD